MTIKRATVRFFVATTGLIASVLELTGAFVRLITACLDRLASLVRRPVDASHAVALPAALAPTVIAPAVPARAPTPTIAMTGDERLVSALLSLFPTAKTKVRAFAASVQGREAPLEVLVKEGIVALSAN